MVSYASMQAQNSVRLCASRVSVGAFNSALHRPLPFDQNVWCTEAIPPLMLMQAHVEYGGVVVWFIL